MKQDILFEYARKAGFPTGEVLAYYDLSGIISEGDVLLDSDGNNKARDHQYKVISGHTTDVYDTYILFNQLYTTGSQLVNTGDVAREYVVALDNHPAQILSNSTSITGSGHFDGQSLLAITKPITGESWTCFLDFSGEFSSKDPTRSQVLVSSMTSHDSVSGFHIGINGSKRLYYEYVAGTSTEGGSTYLDRTVETLPNHLRDFNLLSIAKTPDTIEMSLHRPDQEPFSLNTPLDGYQKSESLLFGGFNSHNSEHIYDPNLFYTGFSGFINSVVLFDDYMTESSREIFAESFYLESYTPPSLTTQNRITKEVTGVEVQSQGIGFGPARYKRTVSGYLKDQNGNLIPNYYNAPFGQAVIYKDVLVDLVSDNDVTSVTGFFVPESPVRSESYVSKAGAMKGTVNLPLPVTIGDTIEIYNHNSYINTTNYNSEKTYSFGGFDLADGSNFRVEGYQLENENFSYDPTNKQPFLQLYRNGFMQYEVSGLFSVSDIFNNVGNNLKEVGDLNGVYKGNYFINDNNAGAEASQVNSLNKYPLTDRINNNRYEIALNSQSDILDEEDSIYFDVVPGASLTGVYEGSDKHFTDDFLNKDVYFDGMKLISGVDYIQSSDGGEVSYLMQASALGDEQGELLFTPQASTSFTRTKYSFPNAFSVSLVAAGSTFSVPSIFNEQIWRNGLRQAPGIDYIKKPNDSLIGITIPSAEKESFVFDSDSTELDVRIKDEEAKMPGYRSKIFSFDSQQKTNLFSGAS